MLHQNWSWERFKEFYKIFVGETKKNGVGKDDGVEEGQNERERRRGTHGPTVNLPQLADTWIVTPLMSIRAGISSIGALADLADIGTRFAFEGGFGGLCCAHYRLVGSRVFCV